MSARPLPRRRSRGPGRARPLLSLDDPKVRAAMEASVAASLIVMSPDPGKARDLDAEVAKAGIPVLSESPLLRGLFARIFTDPKLQHKLLRDLEDDVGDREAESLTLLLDHAHGEAMAATARSERPERHGEDEESAEEEYADDDLDALGAFTSRLRGEGYEVGFDADDVRDDDRVTAFGTPILFWRKDHRPQDFVRETFDMGLHERAARVLGWGQKVNHYKGWATCRICGERLGSSDVHAFGYIWPEGAGHYVLDHGVWVPGLDDLLARALSSSPALPYRAVGAPESGMDRLKGLMGMDPDAVQARDDAILVDPRLLRHGRPILFWTSTHRPQDCVVSGVSFRRRDAACAQLRGGRIVNRYRGMARCRICNALLGSGDRAAKGFIWPEKAEHYVAEHDVWVPELNALLDASRFGW